MGVIWCSQVEGKVEGGREPEEDKLDQKCAPEFQCLRAKLIEQFDPDIPRSVLARGQKNVEVKHVGTLHLDLFLFISKVIISSRLIIQDYLATLLQWATRGCWLKASGFQTQGRGPRTPLGSRRHYWLGRLRLMLVLLLPVSVYETLRLRTSQSTTS